MAMATKPDPIYVDAKSATSYQDGLDYQDFVCARLAKLHIIVQNIASKKFQFDVGENLQGFEIKLDERCADTGRLSIEVAEKSRADRPDWTPSGIMRDDNSWLYIQGNYDIIFIFAKNWLRRWHDKKRPLIEDKHGTIRTFYLDFKVARTMAARVIEGEELVR